MADLQRIKNNVAKMVSMSAPETDIDQYISSEGVSIDDVRNFKSSKPFKFSLPIPSITPTDVISGRLPERGMDYISNVIREGFKPQVSEMTGVSRLSDKPLVSKSSLPIPRSISDLAFIAGTKNLTSPKQLGETAIDIALDPRTYMPLGASGKPQQLLSKAIQPSNIPGTLARIGAFAGGIEKDVLEDVAKIGYKNVLRKKYYDKRLPERLQGVIENNIDSLWESAGNKFNEVTSTLRNTPFTSEWNSIKNEILQMGKSVKKNPFKGPSKQLNERIAEGVGKAQVNTIGDVLDLRRFLDEEIYTASGQGIKSDFANKVRKSFNNVLHKNELLATADNEWTKLQETLRDIGSKITSDTGENFLKRITNLTTKQKEKLSLLESEIGGTPFMQDLTNWGLAQKFLAKPVTGGGLTQMVSKATHPILRGALRTGSGINAIRKIISKGLVK